MVTALAFASLGSVCKHSFNQAEYSLSFPLCREFHMSQWSGALTLSDIQHSRNVTRVCCSKVIAT